MTTLLNTIRNYISDERGSATIEWVGIAAVVFVAAIVITGFVLQSASGLGNAVAGQMDNAATAIEGEG